jgi:thiol-disulfide isomerase/thioredoxin
MDRPVKRPLAARPLAGAALLALAAVVAVLAWKAWEVTERASRLAAAPAPAAPPHASAPAGPPPAPEVPFNQVVTAPRPVPAPAIDLPTADGGRFALAAARGQVVVVNFWATWCPPCAKEMPSMVKLGQELSRRHPGRFRMVAVAVDEQREDVVRFFAGAPYRGLPRGVTVALEPGGGEVTRGYYCAGRGACAPDEVKFPETYVVDREGRIVAFVVGDIDWGAPEVKSYLEALVGA